jgi:hypothetical protein
MKVSPASPLHATLQSRSTIKCSNPSLSLQPHYSLRWMQASACLCLPKMSARQRREGRSYPDMQGKSELLTCAKKTIAFGASKSQKQLSTAPGAGPATWISPATQSLQSTFTGCAPSQYWNSPYAVLDKPKPVFTDCKSLFTATQPASGYFRRRPGTRKEAVKVKRINTHPNPTR